MRTGEALYPEEGAGLLLGLIEGDHRKARRVLPMPNHFEPNERGHRYRLDPQETLQAEQLAEQLGLEVIGVFHSHPDHPPAPIPVRPGVGSALVRLSNHQRDTWCSFRFASLANVGRPFAHG